MMKNINYERSHHVVCADPNLMYKYSPQLKFRSHRPSMHECTNPDPLVDRMIKFFTAVPDIFSKTNAFLLTYKKTCISSSHALRRKRPDNSEGHRKLQNCGSSVRNWLHATVMVHGTWKWLPYFWKSLWTHLYYSVRMTYQV